MGLVDTVPAFTNPALPYDFLNPQDIGNLVAWYSLLDPLGFTQTSGSLLTLADRSGNGFNLANASGMNVVSGPVSGTSAVSVTGGTVGSIYGTAGGGIAREWDLPQSLSFIFTTVPYFSGVDDPTFGGIGTLDLNGAAGFSLHAAHDNVDPYNYWLVAALRSSSNPAHAIVVKSTKLPWAKNYHVVVTYDGSGTAAGMKIFINGALNASTVTSDTLGGDSILAAWSRAFLGSDNHYAANQHPIGDFSFYSSSLTDSNVANLYSYAQSVWHSGN